MPRILLIVRRLVPVGHQEKALDEQKAVIFIVEIIQELIGCKYSEKAARKESCSVLTLALVKNALRAAFLEA